MKTKEVIVIKSAATLRGTFNASPTPQDLPEDVANEFLRLGYAITPRQARETPGDEVEKTVRRGRPKKETTEK